MNSKGQNKKWIILAHCFNMDGRAASQTITDKIPFLMRKGIEPIVISAPTGKKDTNFIHHQVLSPAPSGINFELRKMIEKKYPHGFISELLKAFITLCCLPVLICEKIFINLDSHWSWFITASLHSIFVIKKHRPIVIYSTAGPSSTHLAGYVLKKIFQTPWIAEIHDPLIHENEKKRYQRYAFHKWLEKAIFTKADAVIYFTETACRNARKRTQISHNSHVLRPGANPPKINGVKYEKKDKIHFGHFGSLDEDRNLSLFFKAVSRLIEKQPRLREIISVDIYGTDLDPASNNVVKDFSLQDIVCEHGRLEYDASTGKSGRQRVFKEMHLCDVLVIVHGHTDICDEYIPSKMYEYLLTKRPIMGIASPESELGQILISAGHLAVANNLSDVEIAVENIIHDWENDRLVEIERTCVFTVENAVRELIEVSGV
ncbi:hypothetical protein [Desulfospira joergensenii]|uniref:hypothetical protein n=1 Tax=Desulfospira joergensenii TaxID=53329 RepID=UPI0003B4EE73|nr:hypothetical protein [Desulfospira joergensenii]